MKLTNETKSQRMKYFADSIIKPVSHYKYDQLQKLIEDVKKFVDGLDISNADDREMRKICSELVKLLCRKLDILESINAKTN